MELLQFSDTSLPYFLDIISSLRQTDKFAQIGLCHNILGDIAGYPPAFPCCQIIQIVLNIGRSLIHGKSFYEFYKE